MNTSITRPVRLSLSRVVWPWSGGKASPAGGWPFGKHFALMLLGLCLALPAAQAAERWETLLAIHLIENPTNSTRIGRAGELGPYQFRPGTWKMHTKKPFRLAANRAEADRVAVKHYDWIKRNLERNGIEANPYRIALAWNAGLNAALRDAAPPSSHAYATRVQAIAEDLRQRQLAREP
jgi:hypothetical protein